MWPTYAGMVCASHVGERVSVEGVDGVLHQVRHSADHPTVRLVIRTTVGLKVLDVGPRAVIAEGAGSGVPIGPGGMAYDESEAERHARVARELARIRRAPGI